jgi:spore maturation protein CgeB
MLLRPALDAPHRHFRIGGAQYPDDIAWPANVEFVHHAPPWQHPHFFCSSRATLNITRRAMAQYGWCPSVRLFEAAACGTPLLTDVWDGLGEFFELGTEILPVRTGQDVLQALDLTDSELQRVAQAARAKVLEHHTADARALQFEKMLAEVRQGELAATA